jgi:hypothetical protein
MAVLAGPNDPWWPQARDHTRAQSILNESSIELNPLQKHAFCTSPQRCSLATEVSTRWIQGALLKHAAAQDAITPSAGAANVYRCFSSLQHVIVVNALVACT